MIESQQLEGCTCRGFVDGGREEPYGKELGTNRWSRNAFTRGEAYFVYTVNM